MPFGDGTGPAGLGPMTGRGLGRCAGYSTPGYLKGFGRGWGRGWGRGLGRSWRWRRWIDFGYYPWTNNQQLTKEEEKQILDDELKYLQEEMEEIKKRMKELEEKK